MKLSDTYSKKVDSCLEAIRLLGCDISRILERYKGEYFPGGPDKGICFTQILNKELDAGVYDYLNTECDLAHLKNARAAYEYGIDLVLGWLIEDAVLIVLEEKGRKAILSGNDRYREFLSPRKISTQPDVRVDFASGARLLEIFADWKGTWRNQNHADLRDNKYKKVKGETAVMLGIAPLSSEGFLLDFAEADAFTEGYIAGYRKMGYTWKGVRSILRPLDEVVKDLLSL